MGLFRRKDNDLQSQLLRENEQERVTHGGRAHKAESPAFPAIESQADVERLITQNQLIAAIKLYRERSGLGLKESKDAVEKIQSDMRRRGAIR
jgi:ribosomal protein L7/L12